MQSVVTGVVAAVVGHHDGKTFHVEQVVTPGLLPVVFRTQLKASSPAASSTPLIMFVSGLQFGSPRLSDTACTLLLEYLAGRLPLDGSRLPDPAHIGRVMLVGNSLRLPPAAVFREDDKRGTFGDVDALELPVRRLDEFLAKMAKSVPVDVVPGIVRLHGWRAWWLSCTSRRHVLGVAHRSLCCCVSIFTCRAGCGCVD